MRTFNIPLCDERARIVTMEQALLDLELRHERDAEQEENAAWLSRTVAEMNARNEKRGHNNEDDPGNHDPDVARQRLKDMIAQANGLERLPDDAVYEVVNPYESSE